MNTSTRLRNLADRMGLDGFAEELREIAGELEAPSEPFGYFRVEPMGWTDCAADDEGAIALYERPAASAVPEALTKWADSPELVETGNQWQQGYEHARAWVHVQLSCSSSHTSQPAVPQGEPVVGYRISHPSEPDLGTWLAEEAPNDPTDLLVEPLVLAAPSQPVNRPQNCGTSFCSCIECVCEPEPVTLTLTDDEIDANTVWFDPDPHDNVHCDVHATVNKCIAALREKEQTK